MLRCFLGFSPSRAPEVRRDDGTKQSIGYPPTFSVVVTASAGVSRTVNHPLRVIP
jgi:hypothetical protein